MTTAFFRFYAELNQLLPERRRFLVQTVEFKGRQSVKHLIESQGIPHTEVDLILANGFSVGFDHIPADGELISVYPGFESFDISPSNRLRPEPLRTPKYILDGHLGRLASFLRMLGFDTSYRNDYTDEDLAAFSLKEARILLTRDRGLLKRKLVKHGYLITSKDPRQQLHSVVKRFDLIGKIRPFTRCISCNGSLEDVEKEEIMELLKPKTKRYFDHFVRCSACGKIYWAGSHHQRMQILIEELIENSRS